MKNYIKNIILLKNHVELQVSCICSEYSDINKKGIKLWKIIKSLEELKAHCNNYHKKKISVN